MIKWPEPVAHIYPSTLEKFSESETFGHCYSIKVGCPDEVSVELVTLESAKQAVRDAYEEAVQLVAPKTNRPCACESCDCGNKDDAQRVAEWDAENFAANAIRALIKEI